MKKIILFLTFFVLWKYSSGQDELLKTIRGQHDKCLFSYDDKYLLVYGWGGAKLFINNHGEYSFWQELSFAPDFYPYCADFSRDNKFIAFGNWAYNQISVFKNNNGKFEKLSDYYVSSKEIYSISNVSFSPDGKYIVATPFSNEIFVYQKTSSNTFNLIKKLKYAEPDRQYSLFSNNGYYLIVVRSNGMVYFYDPNNNFTLIDSVNISHNFPSRMEFNVEHVAISPDDKTLSITFSAQPGNNVRCQVYSIQTQNKKIHLEFVKQLSPSRLYSQFKSNDELLLIKKDSVLNYNLLTGKISLFHDNIQTIRYFSLSSNNNYFTVIDVEGNLFLENFTNPQHNQVVIDSTFVKIEQPQHAFFSEANNLLFVADLSISNNPRHRLANMFEDRLLKIFDGNQNYRCKRIVKLPYELWKHTKLLCSPDESILIFYGDREGFSAVPINSLNQENITFTPIKCGLVDCGVFSSDSRNLVVGLESGEIKVFNILNPTSITEINSFKTSINSKITLLKFSKDNQVLMVGSENGNMYFYSTPDFKLLQTIPNGPQEPVEAFFTSNNKRLIIFGKNMISVYFYKHREWKLKNSYTYLIQEPILKILQIKDEIYLTTYSNDTLGVITFDKDIPYEKIFRTVFYEMMSSKINNVFYSSSNNHAILVEEDGFLVTKVNPDNFKDQYGVSSLFFQAGGFYASYINLKNIQAYLGEINMIYSNQNKLVKPLTFNNKFPGFSFGVTEFDKDGFYGTYFNYAQQIYEGVFLDDMGKETTHQYRIQMPTWGLNWGYKILSPLHAGISFEMTFFTFQHRISAPTDTTPKFKPVLEGKLMDGKIIPHFRFFTVFTPRFKNFGLMVTLYYSTNFLMSYMLDDDETPYLITTSNWGAGITYLFGNFKK